MVRMGFPTRISTDVPTLVHATRDTKLLARTAYSCPQCQAKQSELPTDCVVCGLKLVLAPHLARSFHHLFPVPPFAEVAISKSLLMDAEKAAAAQTPIVTSSGNTTSSGLHIFRMDDGLVADSKDFDRACFSCLKLIGAMIVSDSASEKKNTKKKGGKTAPEEILRFQCPACENVFCADCDAYLHETLHNCPGCLSNNVKKT
jgi:transcription initiation factor TFIIH subunit 2